MTEGPSLRWYQNPWVWGVIFGLVFIPLIRPLMRRVPPPPPVIGQLPDFTLIDAGGAPFGTADMAGDVWVVGFFFTSCRTVCPRVLGAMGTLQEKYRTFGHDVRLLAITVDPEHDTPELLASKAAEIGAVADTWSFVTGDPMAVRTLVEGGFASAMGGRTTEANGMIDIAHTERLTIVDWQGGIRGWYSIDELGLDEVYHRSRHVVQQRDRLLAAEAKAARH